MSDKNGPMACLGSQSYICDSDNTYKVPQMSLSIGFTIL